MDKPAILGNTPVFDDRLGIVSPRLPKLEQIQGPLSEALRTGQLTNHAFHVPQFEKALSDRLKMPHVISVGNATLGLILALEALNRDGEVILPSFTYCATAHALYWSRHKPVFVDILPDTFTIDPAAVESAITPNTVAIMAVHIYGHPCEIDTLEEISKRYGLPLLFDSAHAFGSQYQNEPIGQFGDAEIFSFHATKVFPVGEGGCITTHDKNLAEHLKLSRKFGDPGDENTRFPGMNAKMQEFNAIIGVEMLKVVDEHIANRHRYAAYLIERLGRLPGISFQSIKPNVFSNYQNFVILVDEVYFGVSRDMLFDALLAENIFARKYFFPPLHLHDAYSDYRSINLPITEFVSKRVLCLPFYSEMTEKMLDKICVAIEQVHFHANIVREYYSNLA